MQVDGQVQVREGDLARVRAHRHAVGRVEQARCAGERARVLVRDERVVGPDPHGPAPGLDQGATHVDRLDEAARPHGRGIPRRASPAAVTGGGAPPAKAVVSEVRASHARTVIARRSPHVSSASTSSTVRPVRSTVSRVSTSRSGYVPQMSYDSRVTARSLLALVAVRLDEVGQQAERGVRAARRCATRPPRARSGRRSSRRCDGSRPWVSSGRTRSWRVGASFLPPGGLRGAGGRTLRAPCSISGQGLGIDAARGRSSREGRAVMRHRGRPT